MTIATTFDFMTKLLPIVGQAVAKAPEFIALFQEASANLLHPADQEQAQAALASIQAENDAGHDELQSKLALDAKE